jgi:hypothetical protein
MIKMKNLTTNIIRPEIGWNLSKKQDLEKYYAKKYGIPRLDVFIKEKPPFIINNKSFVKLKITRIMK